MGVGKGSGERGSASAWSVARWRQSAVMKALAGDIARATAVPSCSLQRLATARTRSKAGQGRWYEREARRAVIMNAAGGKRRQSREVETRAVRARRSRSRASRRVAPHGRVVAYRRTAERLGAGAARTVNASRRHVGGGDASSSDVVAQRAFVASASGGLVGTKAGRASHRRIALERGVPIADKAAGARRRKAITTW